MRQFFYREPEALFFSGRSCPKPLSAIGVGRTARCTFLLSALCCLFQAAETSAQVWIGSGPEGGSIQAFAIDGANPTTVYAGTLGGGLFKSANGAASWTAVNAGLSNRYIYALAIDPIDPATVYAGTNGGGVFKSTNGGGSWSAVNTGLPVSVSVAALAIDPSASATLYAATWGYGIYQSTNGGGNWRLSIAA